MTTKTNATPQSSRAVMILTVTALLFIGLNIFLGIWAFKHKSTSASSSPLETFSQFSKPVPDFTLTNQAGNPISLNDLKGEIWVANFIFTRCPGPCLAMTNQGVALQKQLKGTPAKDVILVSFSIDPQYDTPEILTDYAKKWNADTSNWHFLTGPEEKIHELMQKGFLLAVAEAKTEEEKKTSGKFVHSTRFSIVDREGNIRGYYDGLEEGGLQKVQTHLETLLKD